MSYLKAEEVLPQELIEMIQQHVNGKAIYIPSLKRKAWGSGTDTKVFLQERNRRIYEEYRESKPVKQLAGEYSLSEKSIQRIIRRMKESGEGRGA